MGVHFIPSRSCLVGTRAFVRCAPDNQQRPRRHELCPYVRALSFYGSNGDGKQYTPKRPLAFLTVRLYYHQLLIETGVTSIVHMPRFGDEDNRTVPIIYPCHPGRNFNVLKNDAVQHVIVVDAAKSACDAVYLLLSMGKKATWVIRSGGARPRAILPFKVVDMLNSDRCSIARAHNIPQPIYS